MKIKTITVRSGGKFPHPTDRYANLEASVELTAEIESWEFGSGLITNLQHQADAAFEQHKQSKIDCALAAARLRQQPIQRDDLDPPF